MGVKRAVIWDFSTDGRWKDICGSKLHILDVLGIKVRANWMARCVQSENSCPKAGTDSGGIREAISFEQWWSKEM